MTTSTNVYVFHVLEGYEWVIPLDKKDFETLNFDGSERRLRWSPVRMQLLKKDERNVSRKQSDFPWFGADAPVFRPRAVDALRTLLEAHGELLTLRCDEAELVVFNATDVIDALDVERSKITRFPSSGRIMKIETHVFRPSVVRDASVFKIPQLRAGPVFFTDALVELAERARLEGVGFRLVWSG